MSKPIHETLKHLAGGTFLDEAGDKLAELVAAVDATGQSGGVRMEYVEDSNAETVKSMEVFSKFALGLPVFWGGAAYMLEARLKYRLAAGKLSFWYELHRSDKVLEDAAKTMTAKIQEKTGFPIFHGNQFAK